MKKKKVANPVEKRSMNVGDKAGRNTESSFIVSKNGAWSLTCGKLGVHGARITLEVNGSTITARNTDAKVEDTKSEISSHLAFSSTSLVLDLKVRREGKAWLLSGVVRNEGKLPVQIGACHLLEIGHTDDSYIDLGHPTNLTTFLSSDGGCGTNEVVCTSEANKPLRSVIVGHIYNPETPCCLITSFLTFDRMMTAVEAQTGSNGKITTLKVECDFAGFLLPAGKSVKTETLYVSIETDPHAALECWADKVGAHYRPILCKEPPVGLSGGVWGPPKELSRVQRVMNNVAAFRKKMPGFSVNYAWVSVSYMEKGLPGNWLKPDPRTFPRGLKPLIARLKRQGIKLGLWMAPFWVCPMVPEQVRRNKNNLLGDADGNPVVYHKKWPYGYSATLPPEQRPDFYVLDGSHPETWKYLSEILSVHRRMGIRYYMMDFLDAADPRRIPYESYHDQRMIRGPQVYRRALKAIRAAAGRDTYFLASSGPTYQNIGLVQAVRTGVDFGEGRAVNPGTWFYPANYLIGGPHDDYMAALQNMAVSFFAHRRWYYNDAGNMLRVDKPLPLNSARINATVFAVCGGPMMLGDSFEHIDPERLALIKLCLPRTSEAAVPVDLFSSCAPHNSPHVFRLDLKTNWGQYRILALFNNGTCERTWELSAEQLALEHEQDCCVYDFWNMAYKGTQTGQFRFSVPGDSVGLFKIEPRKEHPWLLSTDMHLLQGFTDIPEMQWDARRQVLSGMAERPRGECGNLFIWAPPGWKPTDYRDIYVVKHATDNSILIRVPLKFSKRRIPWQLCFEQF